jgi:hypothetical protein
MTQQLMIKSKTAAWYLTQSLNQFLYSTLLDNAAWSTTDIFLTAGQTDPDAGTDAYTLTCTSPPSFGTLRQSVVLKDGSLNRVFSVYLKRKTGVGQVSITADGATYEDITIDGNWVRYETDIPASGTVTPGIKLAVYGDEVYMAWPQIEDGLFATTYSATAANRYTILQIVDGDYPANTCRGVVFLDGRFFAMSIAGEIYQSDLDNAASWSALGFIQSQIDPSDGVFLTKVGSYIVAMKEWSTEFFYDAANPTASILAPIQNAANQLGCASDGSVQDLGGRIIFMSQTRNGFGRSIYVLAGTDPQKISTPNVEKILDTDDLATVYSWVAQVGSHSLYAVTLVTSQVTLVYDFSTQQWSFFTYLTVSGAAKTVTAVSAAGTVTVASHGFSDSDIVKLSSTNASFDGWHVVTNVTTNTFDIQATGTAFSGSGSAQKYTETYFPAVSSVRSNGRQYMQDASTGGLYEFSQSAYIDYVGAIAARIRTPKLDTGSATPKFMGSAELIGDKIDSQVVLRYTDDDYETYSTARPIDLSVSRSRVRRLGNYNRRSFEILHVGNALLRLEALEIE